MFSYAVCKKMTRKSDGIDFWIVLDPPPHENHYVTDSNVTGNVVVVTDQDQPDCKYIEVTLKGLASVAITETTAINRDVYRSSETCSADVAVVWNNPVTPLTAGSHTFPFSLKLRFSSPPSFKGSSGEIIYQVEARVTSRGGSVKLCDPVPIRFVPHVKLIPEVLKPRIMQVHNIPMFWCASGAISLTARIPRTGYCCTGVDAIPLEVDVENGTHRQIRYIRAKLKRLVTYNAEGHRWEKDKETIAVIKSDKIIRAGSSSTWKPPPFSIPKTDCTSITTCGIIALKYYLKVEAVLFGTYNPCVKIDLLLGNVPIAGNQLTGRTTQCS